MRASLNLPRCNSLLNPDEEALINQMNNSEGDLGDIVRARGSATAASGAGNRVFDEGWQPEQLGSFHPAAAGSIGDFGDPFSSFKDPLLHDLAGAMLFDSPNSAVGLMTLAGNDGGDPMAGGGGSLMSQKIVMAGDEMKRPSSIFSKASPMVSPKGIRPSTVFNGDMVKVNTSMAARPPEEGGLQIPSARIPGIKRRKGQAKKVVCIPAPAAASSRPGGEVVPPDLWAWRKYGQKPIKGSPYPRGYYRCSSSKGCSARKQVERSRTDPNMLVITYTSEHNHPWPTQRNALAGSTRSSQPAKSTSSAPKSSPHNQRSPASAKYEGKETATIPTLDSPDVKEVPLLTTTKPVDTDGEHEQNGQLFHRSYEPVPPLEPIDSSVDDLFAGLGELESDPMCLLFSRQLMGAKPEEGREDNAVDPFSMFDWGATLLGETRKESYSKTLEQEAPDS